MQNVDNSLFEASDNIACSGAKRFFVIIVPLIVPTLSADGSITILAILTIISLLIFNKVSKGGEISM